MIRYTHGGHYDVMMHELALTPSEWRRLLKSKRGIKLWAEDGTWFIVRPASKKELAELEGEA